MKFNRIRDTLRAYWMVAIACHALFRLRPLRLDRTAG